MNEKIIDLAKQRAEGSIDQIKNLVERQREGLTPDQNIEQIRQLVERQSGGKSAEQNVEQIKRLLENQNGVQNVDRSIEQIKELVIKQNTGRNIGQNIGENIGGNVEAGINQVKSLVSIDTERRGFRVTFSDEMFTFLTIFCYVLIFVLVAYFTIELAIFLGVRVYDNARVAYKNYRKTEPGKKLKQVVNSIGDNLELSELPPKKKGGRPKKNG